MPAPHPAPPDWSRRLKLRHLDVFRALVDSGSMTAAAASMHLTQSALSHWLRELEDAVGTPLLLRGRRLRPTPAGEVFLRHARRMLGDVARTREEMASVQAGAVGRVRLGMVPVAAPLLVPRSIVRLQQALPGLTVTLSEGTLDQLLPRLQRHEIDIVVGRLEEREQYTGFAYERLYQEPVCVVCGPRHPLLRRRTRQLTWADVAAYPWILPPPETPMRARLEAVFAAAGVPLPPAPLESASIVVNQGVLRDTQSLALMSRSHAGQYEQLGVLRTLPLQHAQGLGAVGMLWADPAPDSAITRVLEALRAEAAVLAAAPA